MDPLTFVAGLVTTGASLGSQFIYTPAQRAADETARAAAGAQREYAIAQASIAESEVRRAALAAGAQSDQSRTMLTLGLAGAGVAVAGLAVWAMRA